MNMIAHALFIVAGVMSVGVVAMTICMTVETIKAHRQ